jgi:hypothetical protein
VLHVYSSETEKVREVHLTPNRNWGGVGLLGCDVSFGYFNKIPLRKKDTEIMNQKKGMKNIFGKLTGESGGGSSSNNKENEFISKN